MHEIQIEEIDKEAADLEESLKDMKIEEGQLVKHKKVPDREVVKINGEIDLE